MNSSSNQYFTMNMTSNISPAWQPQAVLNNNMLQDANITSNWKYRQYIQKNASQIMKYNSMESINASGNNPYYGTNTNQSMANVPHLYNSLQSQSQGYNSDLKQDFLNKQRIKARMVSPAIPTNKF
jgi:hypothetical protein